MAPIKIYIDYASQPSRAVLIFCQYANIEHEIVEIRIAKGQTQTPEYQKVNPTKKVPAIFDPTNNFYLFESHTIFRYLAHTQKIPDHLYPQDLKTRFKLDSYLDWHHTNTRLCSTLLFNTIFGPKMGIPCSIVPEVVTKNVKGVIRFIDQFYLKDQKFIFGQEQFSVADLSCYCELIQLKFMKWDFEQYPNVVQWMKKMESIPQVVEGHKRFNTLLQSSFKAKL